MCVLIIMMMEVIIIIINCLKVYLGSVKTELFFKFDVILTVHRR